MLYMAQAHHWYDHEGVIIGAPDGYVVEEVDFGEYLALAAAMEIKYFRPVLRVNIVPGPNPGDVLIWVKWKAVDAKFAKIPNMPTLMIDFGNGWKKAADHHTVYMAPNSSGNGGIALLVIKAEDWGDPGIGWAD